MSFEEMGLFYCIAGVVQEFDRATAHGIYLTADLTLHMDALDIHSRHMGSFGRIALYY